MTKYKWNKIQLERNGKIPKYKQDKSGKSFVKYNDFYFTNGGAIRVICFDMNKDFIDPNDQLYLAINSKKFLDWLNKNM